MSIAMNISIAIITIIGILPVILNVTLNADHVVSLPYARIKRDTKISSDTLVTSWAAHNSICLYDMGGGQNGMRLFIHQ
jgi:hypothetical protein